MLTQARLKELLEYCPQTGAFRWNHPKGRWAKNCGFAGANQRPTTSRYIRIQIDGKFYLAHRLAWFYAHGVWPAATIDHISGDGRDNSLSNLREATYAENQHNRKPSSHRQLPRGVHWNTKRQRYVAKLSYQGESIAIGSFSTPEESGLAYEARAKELFGAFYRPQTLST